MYELKLKFKIDGDNRTTLMMRNIPQTYTKEMIMMEIDPKFKNKFDYFNFPFDGTSNPGYAFINLKSKSYLRDFYSYFNGRKWKNTPSNKVLKFYIYIALLFEICQNLT